MHHNTVMYLCDYLVNICQFFQAESPVRWPGMVSISLSITSTVPGTQQALKRDSEFKEGIIAENLGLKNTQKRLVLKRKKWGKSRGERERERETEGEGEIISKDRWEKNHEQKAY